MIAKMGGAVCCFSLCSAHGIPRYKVGSRSGMEFGNMGEGLTKQDALSHTSIYFTKMDCIAY